MRSRPALQGHVGLLWAGALATVGSGLVVILLREGRRSLEHHPDSARGPAAAGWRAELRRLWSVGWFRRFLLARYLLLSVELAMPFYAIHAATLHQHKQGSLNGFVIATSLGVILGGPLWRWIQGRSTRAVLVGASVVAFVAGLTALVIDADPGLHEGWLLHAGVFLLVSMASQGSSNGRMVYLTDLAPPDELPRLAAISNVLVGLVGLALALALGALAQLQHVLWPLCALMGLNLLAGLAAARLPAEAGGPQPKAEA